MAAQLDPTMFETLAARWRDAQHAHAQASAALGQAQESLQATFEQAIAARNAFQKYCESCVGLDPSQC